MNTLYFLFSKQTTFKQLTETLNVIDEVKEKATIMKTTFLIEKNIFVLVFICFGLSLLLAQPPKSYDTYGQQPGSDVRVFNSNRINTSDLEFSPSIYENGLVYVSRYENGPIDPKTGETYYELFYAELAPNGMPTKPSSFSTEINSAYHEGPVSFNRSGDLIFFSRTNTHNGVRRSDGKGRSQLKIYQASRGLFDWENVQELPFNSDDYSCMHPALSPNQEKLFFASNMPGSYGGMDLYFVEWKNGRWSNPINLGPEINTTKNEAFPFYHESGILFFSSDGHKGEGGLDLFMIDISARQWETVLNLGAPFNSPQDDLGLVILPNGHSGYFSSSRSGGFGQDDIYMFQTDKGIQGIKPQIVLDDIVRVVDKTTSRRVIGSSLRLFELNKEGLIDDKSAYDMELVPNSRTGELVMKMIRKKADNLGEPTAVSDRAGETILQLSPNKKYLLIASKEDYFTYELEFSTTKEGASKPLEILLEPTNCILLSGTIKSDRFQIPIPNVSIKLHNKCDGTTSIYRSNIMGNYEICLPIGCDYTLEGFKDGYEPGGTQVTTVKLRGSRSLNADFFIHPTSDAILREPIREGTIIVLENIYYDFNKSAIRKGAALDLEALAQLMDRYPSMQVELGAHTDSRGTDEYNLKLSNQRAESAKDFLLQRGVGADRIRAVGYGETAPRNHCVDGVKCSEEGYLLNRRTEVKILNINERVTIR